MYVFTLRSCMSSHYGHVRLHITVMYVFKYGHVRLHSTVMFVFTVRSYVFTVRSVRLHSTVMYVFTVRSCTSSSTVMYVSTVQSCTVHASCTACRNSYACHSRRRGSKQKTLQTWTYILEPLIAQHDLIDESCKPLGRVLKPLRHRCTTPCSH